LLASGVVACALAGESLPIGDPDHAELKMQFDGLPFTLSRNSQAGDDTVIAYSYMPKDRTAGREYGSITLKGRISPGQAVAVAGYLAAGGTFSPAAIGAPVLHGSDPDPVLDHPMHRIDDIGYTAPRDGHFLMTVDEFVQRMAMSGPHWEGAAANAATVRETRPATASQAMSSKEALAERMRRFLPDASFGQEALAMRFGR
jgi:hypothetical protein